VYKTTRDDSGVNSLSVVMTETQHYFNHYKKKQL
jgi:hypothetical protein